MGVEVYAGAALRQRAHHPVAGPVGHLGQNPVARLDQMEVQLVGAQLRVAADYRPGQAEQLTEALDTGEAAADERDGEQLAAPRAGRESGGLVERGQQPVPDRDRLLHVLHADGVLGHAGDREGTGHRAGRHDDDVVGERIFLARCRAYGDRPVLVVDLGHPSGDDLGLGQVPAQRDGGMPGLDRAGQHLG
jgi:hypothetical protein